MKQLKYLSISLLSFLTLTTSVGAVSCGYEEKAKLNSEIANVKTNYEIKERIMDPSEYDIPETLLGTPEEETYVGKEDYIQVNILNLTENMYVEITNNESSDQLVYYYNNTDNGNITISRTNIAEVVKYTIKVYASSNTGCEGTLLKTLYITLPRYNDYSEYDICNKVPNYYLCQKYVTYDKVEFGEFADKITAEVEKVETEEKEEANAKWYEKVGNFIKEHKVIFITGGIMLIVVAGGAAVIIIRKRRRDVI